jgi:superfamily II DNA helicase RecQ
MLLAAALVAACITSFVVFNTREMTQARPISLFAIDEAHCV